MAKSYVMEIDPEVDKISADKMEKELSKRFTNVAKKYTSTLINGAKRAGNVLKSGLGTATKIAGGLAGAVAGVIAGDPIGKALGEIDERLKNYDTIINQAKQFGVSGGKYFQARGVFERFGVDNFDEMLTAYAVKLGEARRGEDVSLQNFLNEKDIVEGMVKFIQSAGNVKDVGLRTKMLAEVFGEDDVLKLAPVLNANLKKEREKIFGDLKIDELSTALNKVGDYADKQAINRIKLVGEDIKAFGEGFDERLLNEQAKRERDEAEVRRLRIANAYEASQTKYAQARQTVVKNVGVGWEAVKAGDWGTAKDSALEIIGTSWNAITGRKNKTEKENTDKILANE